MPEDSDRERPPVPGLADGERTGRAGDYRDARDGAGPRSRIEYPEIYMGVPYVQVVPRPDPTEVPMMTRLIAKPFKTITKAPTGCKTRRRGPVMTSRAQRNMNRSRSQVLAIASLFLGVLIVMPARAASLTQVSRSTWGASGVPSYVEMYIYVPDKLATKPPIVVSAHSCGSSAAGQMGNIPKFKAAADTNGLILILPDNPGQNCWDVGSSQSLKHDGGGDTQAVAQMVT